MTTICPFTFSLTCSLSGSLACSSSYKNLLVSVNNIPTEGVIVSTSVIHS